MRICALPMRRATSRDGSENSEWVGQTAATLLNGDLATSLAGITRRSAGPTVFLGQLTTARGELFEATAHRVGHHIVVELEPAAPSIDRASNVLAILEAAAASFESAPNLQSLCDRAAFEFRRITGFDRVMIYRFLDDDAGTVFAEERNPALYSFLNHHFPGSDIPKQARALYVRNLVRVIPDSTYEPMPLTPAWRDAEPLDMSDCVLRSVSRIHLQYLKNMDVRASASVSIVKDGILWGLIACHHRTPRHLPYEVRVACRTLAGALSRQIKAKEEAEWYRERIRLRSFEDEVFAGFGAYNSLEEAITTRAEAMRRVFDADGFVFLRGTHTVSSGICPAESDLRTLAAWLAPQAVGEPYASEELGSVFPPSAAYAETASGLLAVTLSGEEPIVLMWLRAEQIETLNWAGNPHKPAALTRNEVLTPRASFEAWSETVRGHSRRWTSAQLESAGRIRQALIEVRRQRQLRELNEQLTQMNADKDALLAERDVLIREVNHRVQNSLMIVSSFLNLQARSSKDLAVREQLSEAQRRVGAVALVHRRLYRADQIEMIDLARYLEELCQEMIGTLGPEWTNKITIDFAPIPTPTDRAVTVGLVLTELMINANKYAYGGEPGAIDVLLEQNREELRLIVADQGRGKASQGSGFGTRMIDAMVAQLGGLMEFHDNNPGLRAILTAPIMTGRGALTN